MSLQSQNAPRYQRIAIISALVALVVVLLAGAMVGAAVVIGARLVFPCPSEDWAASTEQELLTVIPSGTRVMGSHTSDCDDQRAVSVMFRHSLTPQQMAASVGREAETAGWVRKEDSGMPCWEKQVEDETTSLRIYGRSVEGNWSTCGG